MRNVRRLYFYLVALISLEMIIWGAVSLAQTVLNAPVTGVANNLASGLSLVLVGAPIFLLHGSIVQRDALRDPEERASRLRAIFFYAVLLATQVPVVQSGISLAARLAETLLGLPAGTSLLGIGQTTSDSVVIMVTNLIAWAYFNRLLRQEEAALPAESPLSEVGRLYRYIWMLYTLVLTVYGTASVLWYILYVPGRLDVYTSGRSALVDGIALLALGVPLWSLAWLRIQDSLRQPGESRSLLRLVVLYGLTITAAVVVVVTGVNAASGVIRILLGENLDLYAYLQAYRPALAALVPFGAMWAFFRVPLQREWAAEPEARRKAALVRLYHTVLAAIGNGSTFIGAWLLLNALSDFTLGQVVYAAGLRNQISGATAAMAFGIPIWLASWQSLQEEAQRSDDQGDHARRSVMRKAYLYLVIFLGVLGTMINAGVLIYNLAKSALGSPVADLATISVHSLVQLGLCAVWLWYHLTILRQDGRQAQAALASRHAAFPVLVFQTDDSAYFSELRTELQSAAPGMPVTFHRMGEGLPAPQGEPPQAVVLPASLAANPGKELADWLGSYRGNRLVAPLPGERWVWLGSPARPENALARDTALAVRQLAEGEPVRAAPPNNPWVIAGYVFGGLFALELILAGFAIVMSFVSR